MSTARSNARQPSRQWQERQLDNRAFMAVIGAMFALLLLAVLLGVAEGQATPDTLQAASAPERATLPVVAITHAGTQRE